MLQSFVSVAKTGKVHKILTCREVKLPKPTPTILHSQLRGGHKGTPLADCASTTNLHERLVAVQAAGAEEPATDANSVGPDRPRRDAEVVVAGAAVVAVVPGGGEQAGDTC